MAIVDDVANSAALKLATRAAVITLTGLVGLYGKTAFDRIEIIPQLEARLVAGEGVARDIAIKVESAKVDRDVQIDLINSSLNHLDNRLGIVETVTSATGQSVERMSEKLDRLFEPRHAENDIGEPGARTNRFSPLHIPPRLGPSGR